MKPPAFHYEKPSSVDGLLDALTQHGDDARILAGGQSLVPMMNFRLSMGMSRLCMHIHLTKISPIIFIRRTVVGEVLL